MKKAVLRGAALFICASMVLLPLCIQPKAFAENSVWDGSVDVSWYDPNRTEYYIDGRMTSYAVWEYEYIDPRNYKGKTLDYRDDDRELDSRATVVY